MQEMELVLKLSPHTPPDVADCICSYLCTAAGFTATVLPAPCKERCLLVQLCDVQLQQPASAAATTDGTSGSAHGIAAGSPALPQKSTTELVLQALERLQAPVELLTLMQQHTLFPSRLQHQQPAGLGLLEALRSCGLLCELLPLHGPQQQLDQLRAATWGSLLAPVEPFRAYCGNTVAMYLSFLNAVTLWLVPPSIVALNTLTAIWQQQRQPHHDQGGSQGALHSPLVPLLVLFQLLWSAVGLKLWRRREAGLLHAWREDSSSNLSTALLALQHAGVPARGQPTAGNRPASSQQIDAALAAVAAAAAVADPAVAAAPAGPDAAATAAVPAAVPALPAAVVPSAPPPPADVHIGAGAAIAGPGPASPRRLLRLLLSIAGSTLLLAAASVVLLLCLNLQGYIPPGFGPLHVRRLARLSQPGGWLGVDRMWLLAQVPLAVRVLATSLFSSQVFTPAAKALTAFEAHRTGGGFDTSLTAKLALLQLLTTFAPLAFVGLAGAGAAAAAAEVASFFRLEILSRLAMELLLPRFTTLFAAAMGRQRRRHDRSNAASGSGRGGMDGTQAAAAAAATAATDALTTAATALKTALADVATAARPEAAAGDAPGSSSSSSSDASAVERAVDELLRPQYDVFSDYWNVSRDIGYLTMFGCLFPPAAVLCLAACLVKIKQDCIKLLTAYARPLPARSRQHSSIGLGAWHSVLLVQVVAAVLTSVFLSGLSSGQLAQLLPAALVPAAVKHAVLAAADARPAESTAAASMHMPDGGGDQGLLVGAGVGTAGPVTQTLSDISRMAAAVSMTGARDPQGAAAAAAGLSLAGNAVCPSSSLSGFAALLAGQQCRAGDAAAAIAPVARPQSAFIAPGDLGSSSSSSSNPAAGNSRLSLSSVGDGSAMAAATTAAAAGGAAAAGHLAMLFVVEHVLLLLLLLVLVAVPDEPAVVRAAKRRRQEQLERLAATAALQEQQSTGSVPAVLMMCHNNPLFQQ